MSAQVRADRWRLTSAALDLAHRVIDAADARRTSDAATIRALHAACAAQAALIRAQADRLTHDRALFERASTAARIGLWICDLPSERLRWSEGVFDMFEFPRGVQPARAETLDCYTRDARRELVAVRADAIARRSGFTQESEIVGREGSRRWIRITATVECDGDVPARLVGFKQDITDEKLRFEQTRYRADFDLMTGLANRTVFDTRLSEMPETGTLLLIDLDGFKRINDTYGHAAGDACLREASRRLREICRETCRDPDLVARIGGDEFAVLIADDANGERGAALGHRIVAGMGRPFSCGAERLGFGASVGLARAIVPGGSVFLRADRALYAAKAAGRGTVRGDGVRSDFEAPATVSELAGVPALVTPLPRAG